MKNLAQPPREKKSSLHPFFRESSEPRVFAHRGFVTPHLENQGITDNTFGAFTAALETGTHYLETDCRVTSDGQIVLFHDADLSRITGESRSIKDLSKTELSARMKDRGGLLTLEEALEAFPQARFNIDVKTADGAERIGKIVRPHSSRVLLTSFSDEHRVRALETATSGQMMRPATSPGRSVMIRILLALASRSERRITQAFSGLDALQIPERHGPLRVLSRRLLDAAHRNGVEVHVWTVNDPLRMTALSEFGIDGIVTDRTDLALQIFRQ